MADFPRSGAPVLPLFVTAAGRGRQYEIYGTSNTTVASGAAQTWVAKLIAYMPVSLPWDYPVQRVVWVPGGSPAGNVDFGIYTADGVRIYNTGSTAMSGSAPQYVTPSPSFMLPAGRYYFAWTSDTSAASIGVAHSGSALAGAMWGLLEETPGSFGLPATMTPIRWARAWGYTVCGITRTTVGF